MEKEQLPPIQAPVFEPDDDRLLILADPTPDKIGGIIIQRKDEFKPTKGIVIAMGETANYDNSGKPILNNRVKIGTKVWYSKLAGVEVNLHPDPYTKEDMYLLVRRSDVMGIIPGEEREVLPHALTGYSKPDNRLDHG